MLIILTKLKFYKETVVDYESTNFEAQPRIKTVKTGNLSNLFAMHSDFGIKS